MIPIVLLSQTGEVSDKHAIQAVIDQFMEGWNRHDAKAFAAVFSKDADFANRRGEGASGQAKIEEFHAPLFATVFSKSHQEYVDKEESSWIHPATGNARAEPLCVSQL